MGPTAQQWPPGTAQPAHAQPCVYANLWTRVQRVTDAEHCRFGREFCKRSACRLCKSVRPWDRDRIPWHRYGAMPD